MMKYTYTEEDFLRHIQAVVEFNRGVIFDDDCADVGPTEDEGLQGELEGEVLDGDLDRDTIKEPDGTKDGRVDTDHEDVVDLWS